jgi:hypothetical protein
MGGDTPLAWRGAGLDESIAPGAAAEALPTIRFEGSVTTGDSASCLAEIRRQEHQY